METEFIEDKNLREKFIKSIYYAKLQGIDYFWVAFLKDGKIIPQIDENGNENLFSKVYEAEGLGKLKSLFWIPTKNEISYGIELKKGQKIVALRRNYIKVIGEQRERRIIYILGYEEGENKKYMFINEKGETKITNDFEFNFI